VLRERYRVERTNVGSLVAESDGTIRRFPTHLCRITSSTLFYSPARIEFRPALYFVIFARRVNTATALLPNRSGPKEIHARHRRRATRTRIQRGAYRVISIERCKGIRRFTNSNGLYLPLYVTQHNRCLVDERRRLLSLL